MLGVFARVYAINLPSRKDRRLQVITELRSLGVSFRPGHVELLEAVRPEATDGFPTIAERGCFLSHVSAVRNAQMAGVETVLILEDDVRFTPAMRSHGERMLQELASRDWDIAFLGHGGPPLQNPDFTWHPLTDRGFGTHCYAVHRRVFARLLNYMDAVAHRPPGHPEGGRMNVDAVYSMFCALHPDVKAVQAQPTLAIQRSSPSDISPQWFDHTPGLLHVARMARVLRSGFRKG